MKTCSTAAVVPLPSRWRFRVVAVTILVAAIVGGGALDGAGLRAETPVSPSAATAGASVGTTSTTRTSPTLTPAPLGLRFGMRPRDVPLPTIVAPAPLGSSGLSPADPQPTPTGQAGTIVSPPPQPAPVSLFGTSRPTPARARVPAQATPRVTTGTTAGATDAAGTPSTRPGAGQAEWTDAYISACEAAFDRMSDLGAATPDWLAWRATHLQAGEGKDFADALAERGRAATYYASPQARAALQAQRSAGLYRLDGAGGRRAVCLLFTAEGLAHVFVAGDALNGIRDGIVNELSARSGLDSFTLAREAARFSLSLSRPSCGLYCRLFGERIIVQRQIWLDEATRVLVATKRAAAVDGVSGLAAGWGLMREVSDGLPDSFVASTDLTRRAHVLRWMLAPASGSAPADADVPGHVSGATVPAASGTAAAPSVMTRQAVIQSFVP